MQGAPGERVKFINNVPHLAFRQSLRSQCGEGGSAPYHKTVKIFVFCRLNGHNMLSASHFRKLKGFFAVFS